VAQLAQTFVWGGGLHSSIKYIPKKYPNGALPPHRHHHCKSYMEALSS